MGVNSGTSTELDASEELKVRAVEDPFLASSNSSPEETTNWNLIYTAGALCALNSVEGLVVGIGQWPYMKTIDVEATAQFYGYAMSSTKIAHAIFAIVFSVWSFKSKSVRVPLAAGRVISMFAYMVYICIEYIPFDKRYTMATVFFLLAIADSSSTVIHAYIAKYSTPKDRPRAFAIIGLSFISSIVVGPLFQLAFSAISYPGYELFPGLYFHIYSIPIWFSLGISVLTLFLILFYLSDDGKETNEEKQDSKGEFEDSLLISINSESPTQFSFYKIRKSLGKLRESNLDWGLIAVCLVVKVLNAFSDSAVRTISSIFFMVQYGWTGEQTVQADAVVMIGFGVLSSVVLLSYIFCKLGEKLPQHKVFLVAIIASGLVFVLTYPFEFTSKPVVLYNATTHSGCNPDEYPWCDTAYAVNPFLYLAVVIILTAPATPLMHTALDTVYSNVLGTIDQSIARGAVTVIDDIVNILTPIFAISVFTFFGVGPFWILNFGVCLLVSILWAFNLEKLGKLCHYQKCDIDQVD